MSIKHNYCGECGKQLPEGAGFCGECGTAVAQQEDQVQNRPQKPRKKPPAPDNHGQAPSQSGNPTPSSAASPETTIRDEGLQSPATHISILLWMMIWVISWLPVGLILAGLYDFDVDMGAMYFFVTAFGSGLGGLLAGLSIYVTLKPKATLIGMSDCVKPLIAGAMVWCIGLLPLLLIFRDDDTLVLALPVLALIFVVLVSHISITQLEKKHAFSATHKEKIFVALWWWLCSLLSVSGVILVWLRLWS